MAVRPYIGRSRFVLTPLSLVAGSVAVFDYGACSCFWIDYGSEAYDIADSRACHENWLGAVV